MTELSPSERVGEPASITLAFHQLEVNGRKKPLQADITDAEPELSRDWGRGGKGAGIGAAGGAVLGAVLGRSVKGAVIGGVVGAAAGTAISLGTGEEDAKLQAGTPMTLALTQPVPLIWPRHSTNNSSPKPLSTPHFEPLGRGGHTRCERPLQAHPHLPLTCRRS